MTTDIRNGILQSLPAGASLRDLFAAAALTGLLGNVEFNKTDGLPLATIAFSQADDMLVARESMRAEAERQKRLAAIGALAVEDWNDALDGGKALDEACAAYVREMKAATDPAPPAEDVGLAVAVQDGEAERLVGASRNGDGS